MGLFSKFRSKDRDGVVTTPKSKKKNAHTNGVVPAPPPKPHWDDAWTRKEVEPEEIQELLRGCTYELKSRGKQKKDHSCIMIGSTLTVPFSSRYAFPALAFPAGFRSKCGTHVHPKLF